MTIEDLIAQYIDGELPSEAESELHHRLAVSPEARRLFRAQIALHGVAQDARVLHRPTAKMRADLFERLQREEGMRNVPVVPSAARASELPHPIPSQHVAGAAPSRRRRLIPMLLPFFIGVFLTGIAFWAFDRDGVAPSSDIAGRVVEDDAAGSQSAVAESSEAASPLAVESYSDAAPSSTAPVARKRPASAAATEEAKGESFGAERRAEVFETIPPALNAGGGVALVNDFDSKRLEAISSDVMAKKSSLARGNPQVQPELASTLKQNLAESMEKQQSGEGVEPSVMSAFVPPSASAPEPQPEAARSPAARSSVTREKHRNSLALMAGLQQNVLVGIGGDDVQPQSSVKVGAEFGDGSHQVYGMVARSSYRQTTAVRTFEVSLADSFDEKNSARNSVPRAASSSSSAEQELWGGLGYRFNGKLTRHWSAGGGVWAGAGENYVRIGAELPISYRVIEQVRIELLPTIQYVRAYGDTRNVDTKLTAEPATNGGSVTTMEGVQTTTELDSDREIQAGIGIGISITIP